MCLGFVLEQLPRGDECTAEHAADRAKSLAWIQLSAPDAAGFFRRLLLRRVVSLERFGFSRSGSRRRSTYRREVVSRPISHNSEASTAKAGQRNARLGRPGRRSRDRARFPRTHACNFDIRARCGHSGEVASAGISCDRPIPGNHWRIRAALQAPALRRLLSTTSAVCKDLVVDFHGIRTPQWVTCRWKSTSSASQGTGLLAGNFRGCLWH